MQRLRIVRRRSIALVCLAGVLVAGCGDDTREQPTAAANGDPGPIHVHGLGIDPADGSLIVATHTGLFRAAVGSERAVRVTDSFQDTMGFTVLGPNRFLGSGHPDGRESLPPFLGLIESRDAGRSWSPVSLQGEVDFHVLEASGERVYGFGSDFETREPRFLVSSDGGREWDRREPAEALVSLAISPRDPDEIVASGEQRVWRSLDGGRRWRPVDAPASGFLTWSDRGLFLVALDGRVWRSDAGSGPFEPTPQSAEGHVAAADSGPDGELLVALHDGAIKQSDDAGQTWTVRSRSDAR